MLSPPSPNSPLAQGNNKFSNEIKLIITMCFIVIISLSVFVALLLSKNPAHNCNTSPMYNDCVSKYFLKLAEAEGTASALAKAKDLYKTDARFRSGCHDTMHTIGRNAAREFLDTTTAFGHGTFLCWSGYYHGVVEGVLRKSGDEVIRPETLDSLCGPSNLLPIDSFARFHCTHALGHAVMYRTNNDLPASLSHCSSLTLDPDRHRCALGAFMENYLADGKEHPAIWQPKDDLLFPCTVTDKLYEESCFFVQGMFAMKQHKADTERSVNFCSSLPGKDVQFQCVAGVGKVIADIAVFSKEITRTACSNMQEEFQEGCFFGALQEIVGVDADMGAGEAVCTTLLGAELALCENALTKVRFTLGL